MFKKYLNNNATGFIFFYKYLGNRVFILLISSLFVAILDGFGLAMFIPMFQLASGQGLTPENAANLNFIPTFFTKIGIAFTIQNVFIITVILFILKGLIYYLHQYYQVHLQLMILRKLRIEAVDGLACFKYTRFLRSNSGRIQNTISDGISRIVDSFQLYFFSVSSLIMIMAYMAFSLTMNFQFSIFIILGSLIAYIGFRFLHRRTKLMSVRFAKSTHDFQLLLLQQVHHFKYLKATDLMSKYVKKIKARLVINEEITKRMAVNNAIIFAIREPVVIIIIVALIYIQFAVLGKSFPSLILSLLLFYRALNSIMQFQSNWNRYLQTFGNIVNYKDFSFELHEGKEEKGNLTFQHFNSNVQLADVHFSQDNKHIIKGVSLTVKKNETIALVGKSGSGKTTLVNLVAGLIPASSGDVRVDDVSIKDLNPDSYRSCLGYITQDPVIFNDTLFNNITCWSERSEQNVLKYNKVIRQACLQHFTDDYALLGTNGINLSGGEKQRIAIARELYKDVKILIIDEGTSSLDTETELMIRESIETLKGKLTILIIAHRLSTIRNADRVVILNNGQIEAEGTYDSLKESSVKFKNMISLQQL